TKPFGPVGIIDIGSNSVRFVAYGGSERVPSVLFNEKLMAALGRGVARDGKLSDAAMGRTLEALARFRQLAREMKLKRLHTVATAAVRDASNGKAFLKRVAEIGLKPRVISGDEEAELAGLGVVSAIPDANGIVADLGGGSLELIGVARGAAGEGVTLPLGVFRLGSQPDSGEIARTIRTGVKNGRLKDAARGHCLYLVGGSFRALALLDMKIMGHPLPIIHHHRILPERLPKLRAALEQMDVEQIKAHTQISSARIPTLPAVVTLLETMMNVLGPRKTHVSAFGLREGLLYRDLDPVTKNEDPLLAAALEVGERLGRFGDHGAAIDIWMNPLFPDESHEMQRLRLATCLLGDIAWNAHPDFRAERAVDMALHGNWVGIDSHGRAVLGRALCSAFGGDGGFSPKLAALLRPGEVERVIAWGRALRLAQRLSGGTEVLLRKTVIELAQDKVLLSIPSKYQMLYSEAVERRLTQLARALNRQAEVRFT
ncbi:MAG TPA: Ppx/GppA family phosphatase, partial [Sphingomicrobium sp.]|nr:Ppx/GppA family phosphatase [Sphingomicrobium sp.]